jgi:septum formation protein
VSAPPAVPLLLASTSPQRRAILEQLRLPFDVVAPRYEERDEPGVPPVELVRRHAEGKAQ